MVLEKFLLRLSYSIYLINRLLTITFVDINIMFMNKVVDVHTWCLILRKFHFISIFVYKF